jgi:hypothetical protein
MASIALCLMLGLGRELLLLFKVRRNPFFFLLGSLVLISLPGWIALGRIAGLVTKPTAKERELWRDNKPIGREAGKSRWCGSATTKANNQ